MRRKNFLIMIGGQIVSIITGTSLSFMLGLYILETTKSATIFGIVTAISIIPWALFAPIGGILADKYNQRNIMVVLDFVTGLVLLGSYFFDINVFVVVVLKVLFSSVQALYYPSVVSALPLLVEKKEITRATSLVSQINAVSRILSPMISGIIYALYPIHIVILICGIFFVLSAFLECFIKIKKHTIDDHDNTSMKSALLFLKTEPLTKIIFIGSIIVSAVVALNIVAIPYIINIYLQLSSTAYGIISGIISLGSFFAGIIVFVFHKRFTINDIYIYYLLIVGFLLLSSLALSIDSKLIIFITLAICFFFINIIMGILYIIKNVSIQQSSPQNILGKVMSIFTLCMGFFEPIFQIIYGFLFENIAPNILFLLTSIYFLPVIFFIYRLLLKYKKIV